MIPRDTDDEIAEPGPARRGRELAAGVHESALARRIDASIQRAANARLARVQLRTIGERAGSESTPREGM